MSALHVFDMDGTLLRGSACLDISRHMGAIEQVNEIEERWGRGLVGHVEFYELCIPLWSGLTDSDIDDVFVSSQWLDGVQDVWKDIAARGEHSAVISLSPQFFVQRLSAWGLETAHGAGVSADTEVDPRAVLTPAHKPRIVDELLTLYGLSTADCVAYGDSSSDVPLFKHLTHSVAVNGSASVLELASVRYDGDNVFDAYQLGRELVGR